MKPERKQLLKELTEAHGIPGFEEDVRAIIRKNLGEVATIECDNLGSIVCKKEGSAPEPKIIIPGHMDEIGFLVKFITDEGFIRFSPMGGWFDQVVLAQKVVVKTRFGDIPGVTGSKPPHILTDEERKKVVEKKDMFIDIGASSREEAEEEFGVRPGDPIVPDVPMTEMKNEKILLGKAWDDRIGCGIFIEVIKALADIDHPNTVFGAGTVQEEVGTRGAETAANLTDPDICLVAESGIAADVPGIKPEEAQGKLGEGPVVYLLDSGMIAHTKLRDFVLDRAESEDIPYQLSVLERGATDGRPIHLHAKGVPSLFIGVAARYIHSHLGLIHTDDYENAIRLMVEVIKKLDKSAAEEIARPTRS